jgi:2-oxoisovalerate dehydrogenase E1 component alpha subunit
MKRVEAGLSATQLVELFQQMVVLRTFDERAVALQRQGRIGNYPPCWGEEAAQVGSFFACDESDWLFPSYRQQSLPILRGVDPATILKYRRGIGGREGFWNPREHRCAPICIPIATHLPHAVGLAWAAAMKGEDICSIAYFGDGATSEGDFHEAMNFAAVFKAPVVFFCTNNQWAISTPFERQTATATVAEKASAYGMPGVRVDGLDVIACWQATHDALARARGGEGPTLIEALTYRVGPHATADDPARYRDESEAQMWRKREPVQAFSSALKAAGILSDERERTLRGEAKEFVDRAVAAMDAAVPLDASGILGTTYVSGIPYSLAWGHQAELEVEQ